MQWYSALVSGVATWLNNETVNHLIDGQETIREVGNCLLAQRAIAWNLVMRGLLSNEWAVVQEAFANKRANVKSRGCIHEISVLVGPFRGSLKS
jgi:hypothetical protein